MRNGFFTSFVVIFLFFIVANNLYGADAYHVGYKDIQHPFKGRIWYPASTCIHEKEVPGTPLFKNLDASKDAPLVASRGKRPLLILSHGSGGTVYRLDWAADYFARRGWIVAGINHPGNTYGDNSAAGLAKIWERPKQISEFLNYLLSDSEFARAIDKGRIAAAGHSAGGTAVLLLAGARMSREHFQNPLPLCKPQPKDFDDEDCANLKKMNFKKFDAKDIEGDYRDERIGAVVALDPAFSRSIAEGQVLVVPALIVLAEKLKSHYGQIYTRDFLKRISGISGITIPGSIHISFISECSEDGMKKGMPICVGDEGKRGQIHEQTDITMEKFLNKSL